MNLCSFFLSNAMSLSCSRMRAMAAQNAGTLAGGLPAGIDLGPEYQVMGSSVYYGDGAYSEYGAAATRQMGGPQGGPDRNGGNLIC